ncbi:MAG TPA: CheR family methyltransferase [Thermoanaerobaculia bacterium]
MSDTPSHPSPGTAQEHLSFVVVGLGGSAGSIQAFREFFRNVPADSDMAFVVVLHLSPEYDSRLAEVLQGSTDLPVSQVRERVRIAPNQVYVIPPNKSLAMSDGSLVLSEMTGFEERRAPIDIFFRTLADTHDSRAVCVVLSGSGADGSMGLRRIKENNGLAIVQDPAEAQFDDMPRNSIATGLVDFVLPVAEMPRRMIAYRDQLRASRFAYDDRADADEQAIVEIFTHLRARTGHDFTNYKRATVLRRIERRLAVREVARLPDYARLLSEQPDEADALLRELLISVTNFFRDRNVWERVEETIVPQLLLRKRAGDQVRVWAAGCATGEEAYSIAMLLAEAASHLTTAPEIQIFATDLDEEAIAKARSGFYTAAETADVSPERLRRHFVKDNDGFRIRRELREIVLFAHHNLIKDPPFSHLDFVSCRNVLIYLNRTAQKRAVEVLHFALEPGGCLLLGNAETPDGAAQLFSTVDKESHIYESRAVPRVMPPAQAGALTLPADLRAAPAGDLRTDANAARFAPLDFHQRLLEEYAPPSLIVDEQYTIVHLSDHAVRYVRFAPGEASLHLLQVVRPELRAALRTALFQAAHERAPVVLPVAAAATPDAPPVLNLIVRPALREGEPPRGYFLVLFEEAADAVRTHGPATPAEPVPLQLEEEVVRLRSQMRAAIEQYELQAEEAKAANEELQAMNEELRSTAEELETSQEELQSLNEELQTVNQELKVKIEEISHANDDMRNLMSSTEIGTIFVDRGLRVKLFTPRIRDIFNLIAADVGRPLLDITNKLMIDDLAADVELVLERLQPIEREVQTRDGRWHLMRLLPYRTADDHIEGTVLTFVDVTDRKRAGDVIRSNEERQTFLLALADRLRSQTEPRAMMQAAADALGRHLHASRVSYVEIDPARGEDLVIDGSAEDPRLGPEERAALAAAGVGAFVRMVLGREGPSVAALEVHHPHPRQWTDAEIHLIRMVADRTWVAVERARAELALRQSEERHRIIVENARDYAIITTDAEGRITSWSPGAEAAFGWSAPEAFMQPLALIFLPEDLASGEPEKERRTARERGGAPDVRWHARKGGARVFIDGITRALETPGGELQGFLKIGQDVTARRRTEEALRDSEVRLQAVTNLVPDLLWSNDPNGETDWFNQRWLDYTGQTIEQARGSGWLDAIHPDDRGTARENFSRAVQSGDTLRHEHRIRSASGESRWFLVQAEPLRDRQGRIIRWFGAATDIQEQRVARDVLEERVSERTAQLEELSRQRQQLLERLVDATEEERRRIARELHDELGQHITALRVGLHQPQGESRPRMEAIVQRLDQTIERLTLELRPPVLDHLGLHGAIASLAEAYAAASGMRIDVHMPAVEGERFSDEIETTIYRVVQEALTNVWKHASASTVSVILEREGDGLRMIVEDDGQGFDGGAALFGTAARGRFGLLGMRERLALVQGSLDIESRPESGTTIYARVPLAGAEESS